MYKLCVRANITTSIPSMIDAFTSFERSLLFFSAIIPVISAIRLVGASIATVMSHQCPSSNESNLDATSTSDVIVVSRKNACSAADILPKIVVGTRFFICWIMGCAVYKFFMFRYVYNT